MRKLRGARNAARAAANGQRGEVISAGQSERRCSVTWCVTAARLFPAANLCRLMSSHSDQSRSMARAPARYLPYRSSLIASLVVGPPFTIRSVASPEPCPVDAGVRLLIAGVLSNPVSTWRHCMLRGPMFDGAKNAGRIASSPSVGLVLVLTGVQVVPSGQVGCLLVLHVSHSCSAKIQCCLLFSQGRPSSPSIISLCTRSFYSARLSCASGG